MAVPAVIFVVCLAGGVYAASRWLPELAAGPVGGLAFFAVCGLSGAGLGLTGLRIYGTVRTVKEIHGEGGGVFGSKGDVLAGGLAQILFDAGTIFAFAAIVYLLAPRSIRSDEPEPDAALAEP